MNARLVWFRADLRVHDNRALHAACRDREAPVVAVFIVCRAQWRQHDWGDPRVDFTLRSLDALRVALRALGIPLRILREPMFDTVPQALDRLARELHASDLYFSEEPEVNEQARDRAVRARFEAAGRSVHSFVDQTILDVGAIRTTGDGVYSVFTPFKRRWLETVTREGDPPVLPPPRRRPPAPLETEGSSATMDGRRPTFRADLWPAGHAEAARRLAEFARQRIAFYRERRDLPAVHGTSTLSPYLAVGAISPRECFAAARGASGEGPGAETWINELIWREFYRHLLLGHPRLSKHRAFRPETEAIHWRDDEEHFAAWAEGRTGVPIVDAAMRQLARAGWMHNRARMIAAMFLTKDLLIDWRRGEQWFMQHLVDADLASNNGGWQWCASTGADAAPYFRVFNPFSQSRKFDPRGDYIRRFVPELAALGPDEIHEPYARGAPPAALDYPRPIVDHAAARRRAIEAFKGLKPA